MNTLTLIQYRRRQLEWYEHLLTLSFYEYVLIILAAIILYQIFRRKKGEYHSNWSTLVPSFKYSTKEFYQKLHKVISSNEIDGIKLKVVTEKEKSSPLSDSREYFRIRWKEYSYYICAAPFGDGFFISWWLYYKQRKREIIVGSIPVIGSWLQHKLFKQTMYRSDTMSMYMTYCHEAMKQVLEDVTKDTNYRLSESEAKPIVKDIFKR